MERGERPPAVDRHDLMVSLRARAALADEHVAAVGGDLDAQVGSARDFDGCAARKPCEPPFEARAALALEAQLAGSRRDGFIRFITSCSNGSGTANERLDIYQCLR